MQNLIGQSLGRYYIIEKLGEGGMATVYKAYDTRLERDVAVKIIRPGEEPGQGIGYLEDGTMVVVEAGRDRIGETVPISVTSVLQTSAGRMVFGRINDGEHAEYRRRRPPGPDRAGARPVAPPPENPPA